MTRHKGWFRFAGTEGPFSHIARLYAALSQRGDYRMARVEERAPLEPHTPTWMLLWKDIGRAEVVFAE